MRRELTRLYVNRVRNFIAQLKRGTIFSAREPLSAVYAVTDEHIAYEKRKKHGLSYKPIRKGETWGHEWQSAWFHLTGTVPKGWAGKHVVLHLNFNGEALLFDDLGCPVYSFTNQSVFDAHYGKDVHHLIDSAKGGEPIDVWVEAAASQLFGINRQPHAERMAPERHGNYTGRVVDLEICAFDTDVWHLLLDVEILFNLYHSLPENTPRRGALLVALNKAIDLYADDPANAPAARSPLQSVQSLPPNPADMAVTAVGHAHIDTGWLWPVKETIRKCARTFASQIHLIETYPDYVFGASQPQHYAFVKAYYPALYEKIRKAVADGRWECQGGMWVEADCNLISGESMVRQILHGKNFFMDEFGIDVRNLWIPDVFGYSASMPQIICKAGMDFFLTQKISWNFHNEFPHNTFIWRGIDGSEILTHFPPENTYNANLEPGQLREAQKRLKENDRLTEFISLFGIGDGGGGPKEEYIERGMRLKALNGSPKVTFGKAQEALERLAEHSDELDTWFGELYLELHRGTLTTQARTKKGNRKLELKLRETEMICSMLPLSDYPQETLDALWKTLLINQFHDILPGSSINMVYENTLREYDEAMTTCDDLIRAAAEVFVEDDKNTLTVINTLSYTYTAPIRLPSSWAGIVIMDASGTMLAVQDEPLGPVVQLSLPPLSIMSLHRGAPCTVSLELHRNLVLENRFVRYEFAEDGRITRAVDKTTKKEIIASGGQGNLFSLYVDRPQNWDAWDVDIYYEDQLVENARPIKAEVLGGGAVRKRLRFELAIGQSTIVQETSLSTGSKRLDFYTRVDWQESHKMLRVAFETSIQSPEATCDIQYGYIRRPTHRNTSWDMAKFEVAAHRYVDISDNDSGVALLNDCKYGHKVHENILDLNLLRAPTEPDPDADLGDHTLTYSFLPHDGPLIESDVMAQAAMLNQPPIVLPGKLRAGMVIPARIDAKGISLEVLKKAEKEDCLVIRLVETLGKQSTGTLTVNAGTKLIETDLMEWHDGRETDCTRPVSLTMKPFEIRTYKISPATH